MYIRTVRPLLSRYPAHAIDIPLSGWRCGCRMILMQTDQFGDLSQRLGYRPGCYQELVPWKVRNPTHPRKEKSLFQHPAI